MIFTKSSFNNNDCFKDVIQSNTLYLTIVFGSILCVMFIHHTWHGVATYPTHEMVAATIGLKYAGIQATFLLMGKRDAQSIPAEGKAISRDSSEGPFSGIVTRIF